MEKQKILIYNKFIFANAFSDSPIALEAIKKITHPGSTFSIFRGDGLVIKIGYGKFKIYPKEFEFFKENKYFRRGVYLSIPRGYQEYEFIRNIINYIKTPEGYATLYYHRVNINKYDYKKLDKFKQMNRDDKPIVNMIEKVTKLTNHTHDFPVNKDTFSSKCCICGYSIDLLKAIHTIGYTKLYIGPEVKITSKGFML